MQKFVSQSLHTWQLPICQLSMWWFISGAEDSYYLPPSVYINQNHAENYVAKFTYMPNLNESTIHVTVHIWCWMLCLQMYAKMLPLKPCRNLCHKVCIHGNSPCVNLPCDVHVRCWSFYYLPSYVYKCMNITIKTMQKLMSQSLHTWQLAMCQLSMWWFMYGTEDFYYPPSNVHKCIFNMNITIKTM